MAEATLILAGASELAVRMALINYQDDLDRLKKKEEDAGVATAGTDELLAATKDILGQLGWKPVEKTKTEVVRDPLQIDFTSPPADPKATRTDPENPGAEFPKPEDDGVKHFTVKCLDCSEVFQARGLAAECPSCGAKFTIRADPFGEPVRLVRRKGSKKDGDDKK